MEKRPFFDSLVSPSMSHISSRKNCVTNVLVLCLFFRIVLSPVRAQTAQNERKTEMESESESRDLFCRRRAGCKSR